jgi:hypothetical protein
MKRLLLFCTFIAINYTLFSQSKNLKADTNRILTSFSVDPNNSNHEAKLKVKNISTSTLNLLWIREELLVPTGGSSFICDKNLCYAPFTGACPLNDPNRLAPGESLEVKLTYTDNGSEDPAHFVIWVFEKEDTSSKVKLDFLYNVVTSTTNPKADYSKVKVYPNPANTAFSLDNAAGIQKVELYSLLGRKVSTHNLSGGRSIDISNLSEGIYVVKLFNKSNQLVKTVRLQKRENRA